MLLQRCSGIQITFSRRKETLNMNLFAFHQPLLSKQLHWLYLSVKYIKLAASAVKFKTQHHKHTIEATRVASQLKLTANCFPDPSAPLKIRYQNIYRLIKSYIYISKVFFWRTGLPNTSAHSSWLKGLSSHRRCIRVVSAGSSLAAPTHQHGTAPTCNIMAPL